MPNLFDFRSHSLISLSPGIDALVNDSIVSIALTFGAYVVGLLCSSFAYLYLRYTDPSYNANGE